MPTCRSFCLIALVALAALSAGCGKPMSKEQYLTSGDAFAKDGKDAEAVVQYRNALALDNKYGDAHYKLAQTYVRLKDVPKAMGEYVRAADLQPTNTDAQIQATRFLLLSRRFEDAQSRAEAVLARDPKNIDAQIARATALAGLKDVNGAIDELDEAIRMNPADARSYMLLGAMQVEQKRSEEAEKAFKRAVDVDPTSLQAQEALAAFYWSANRLAEAETWLRRAVETAPSSLSSQRALAIFLMTTGRAKEAEAPLKAVADRTQAAAARLVLADYYVTQGRSDEARPILESAAKQPDAFAAAKVRLARLDAGQQRMAAAYGWIAEVLAKEPKNADALTLRAQLELSERKNDQALVSAKAAVAANAASPGAQTTLGDALAVGSDFDAALRAFNEALRLNPRLVGTKLKLVQLYLQKRDTTTALQMAQEALAAAPTSATVRLMHARALAAKGDLTQAQTELNDLLKASPNSAQAHAQLGQVYFASQDRAGARREFDRALQISPSHFDALRGKVFLDLLDKRGDQALASIEQQLEKAPTSAALLLLAADTYAAIGDAAKQEATLNKLLEIDPNNMQAFVSMAALYVRQGKLEQAKARYETLSARPSAATPAKTMVAMILEAQGRRAEATKVYEQVVAFDSEAGVAANNLAWMYAEDGGNLDVALTLAQTAKRKMPNVPAVDDTLGWVYYKKDLAGPAVAALESAVKGDPKSSQYFYHLGLAHLKNGHRAQAGEALDAALKLKPDYKEAQDARARL